jgi:hypothetical protein
MPLQDPIGQASGCAMPALGHFEPAGHVVHSVEADAEENDPTGHSFGTVSFL